MKTGGCEQTANRLKIESLLPKTLQQFVTKPLMNQQKHLNFLQGHVNLKPLYALLGYSHIVIFSKVDNWSMLYFCQSWFFRSGIDADSEFGNA